MRSVILLWLWMAVGLLPLYSYAQRPNSLYWAYIEQYAPLAVKEMKHSGVPASITLAQGLLESGAGRSYLATEGKNHFGIKCGGDWRGPSLRRTDDAPNECFRAYASVEDSYRDHSNFLRTRQRYAFLFNYAPTDYKAWAHGLKQAGYATNPQYAYSLIGLIEAYRLFEYDVDKHRDKGHTLPVSSSQEAYAVSKVNDTYYIIARGGETFKSLSKVLGVSTRKLVKYNELPRHYVFRAGEVVMMSKKQKRGHEGLAGQPYRVQEGDTMHSIAQRYAIRLKSLYQLNGLSSEYRISVGDLLWLY